MIRLNFISLKSFPNFNKYIESDCLDISYILYILYILYINPIAFPGEITIQIEETLTKYWEHLDHDLTLVHSNISLPSTVQSVKYMDDATVQESLDLDNVLIMDTATGRKVLPPNASLLQNEISTLKRISDSREMRLN